MGSFDAYARSVSFGKGVEQAKELGQRIKQKAQGLSAYLTLSGLMKQQRSRLDT